MVFVDGQFITLMQAGVYTFPIKTQAEIQIEQQKKELNAEQRELEKQRKAMAEEQRKKDKEYAESFEARGVFGEIGAFGRGVMNFLFGKKKEDTPQQHKQRVEKTQQKLKLIPSPKVCRVYIVSNRVINLIFGSQDNDGVVDFAPMIIPTKMFDVQIAVSMQLSISNLPEFVKNYLADRASVSILDFQNMLMPGVKATLTRMLRNFDYQQTGIPETIVNNLKNNLLISSNERLSGIQVDRVLDITDQSVDFDRFRAVERELYASEKELGFLQRTGEFRNRLEQEQNKQIVNRALNTEDLRRALQAINTDQTRNKLLNDAELEQFVLLLESQQRIRRANLQKDEAIAMEEVRVALIDMKKCGLVKDEELAALETTLLQDRMERNDSTAALENTLLQRRIGRENITEIMRVQATHQVALAEQIAEFELSDNKMGHEMANMLRQARNQGELTAIQIGTKRQLDDYRDEREDIAWNRDFQHRTIVEDYDWKKIQREQDYAWQNAQRAQQASQQNALFDHQLTEQKTQADFNRSELSAQNSHNREMERLAQLIAARDKAMTEMSRHEEAMNAQNQATEQSRILAEKDMTQEQIAAAHMSDIANLDAAAQTEMAKMMGSGNRVKAEAAEQAKAEQAALYERMMQMMQNNQMQQGAQNAFNQEMFVKMALMMQQGMMGMGQQQNANQQAMYDQQQAFQQQRLQDQMQLSAEYRENMMHQQTRMDHTQDQAMGSMSQINQAAASNICTQRTDLNSQQNPAQPQYTPYRQPAAQPVLMFCPSCGAKVPEGEMFCGECGQKIQ